MTEENTKLFDQLGQNNSEEENTTTNDDAFAETQTGGNDELVVAPKTEEEDFDFNTDDNLSTTKVEFDEEDYDDEKEEAKKEYVIEKAEFIKPITRDGDGNLIEPKMFNEKDPNKKGYTTKVKITYKDSDYISLIPNVKWYLSLYKNPATGKKTYNAWFNVKNLTKDSLKDNFTSAISKIYYKYCIKNDIKIAMDKDKPELKQGQFLSELSGKKVKLEQWKTNYEGSERYRIDIKEFS